MTITTVNPATGRIIKEYTEMSGAETDSIIESVHGAFLKWREMKLDERSACMRRIADGLRRRKKEYSLLMAQEMGKPLVQGEAETEKCAMVCEHYAEKAREYLNPRIIPTEMDKSYVTYQPLGVVFAIMPWNFPFWQVFRFAAPTLMAGNAAVLKHAPICTGTALAVEALFAESGFVDNVFRTVIISEEAAGRVISHSKIAAVTLTGSPRAGSVVGAEAAKALKKSVLELGGCDPYIILEDADLKLAAEACVMSRMLNSGQSCIAAKRLIVIESIQAEFEQLLKKKIKEYPMGNPLDAGTKCGPLARKDIRDHVHDQVQKSIQKGAGLIAGGDIPPQEGFFYPPTILNNIQRGMPAWDEEIFGPVISVISAANEKNAVDIANDTSYGLGGGIFTRNVARGEKIAVEKIQAGSCSINTFLASDPRLPFGGIKNSGYGRELSAEGIHSFVNIKTINVKGACFR